MKKTSILTFLAACAAQIATAQCTPAAANIYSFTYNNSRYEIVKENRTWDEAAACASMRGGKLAEIDNQAEQNALFTQVNNAGITAANTVAPDGGGASYLWLGGNDLAREGRWVWDGNNTGFGAVEFWEGTVTGTPVGGRYNNWGNEPDNFNSQNGLGFAFTNWPRGAAGQWNDVQETNRLYYIIEFPQASAVPSLPAGTFAVYPNPVTQRLTITHTGTIPAASYTVIIRNALGQELMQVPMAARQTSLDLSALSSGIYFLHVTTEGHAHGTLYAQRIIKQ